MDLRQLTASLAVSPQIEPSHVESLAAAGFKVLVNNRPDGEVGPELEHRIMAEAAAAAGMTYHYIPFEPGQISPELISEFAKATSGTAPVIAYCRSGNRCTVLWALTQANKRPIPEVLKIAATAGYDISSIAPLLQSLSSRRD